MIQTIHFLQKMVTLYLNSPVRLHILNMMLPYLKRKEASARLPGPTEVRKPDPLEGEGALNSAAIDILMAIKRNDSRMLADALRATFQLLDLEPHAEGPHK
jgi:hypothetical protein